MDSGQVASNLLVMVVTFLFAAFFLWQVSSRWCKVAQAR